MSQYGILLMNRFHIENPHAMMKDEVKPCCSTCVFEYKKSFRCKRCTRNPDYRDFHDMWRMRPSLRKKEDRHGGQVMACLGTDKDITKSHS